MVWRYLLSRLWQGVVVLFGAVTISFVLTNAIGKPADVIGGPFMTAEQRAALNERLGYDRPLLPRFIDYLAGIARGDFGVSYRTNDSAIGEVLRALPNTLILVVTALALATVISLALAVFSATHREGGWDRALRRTIGILQGMPEFWLALMLILVFSVQLTLLPSFGFQGLASLALPVASLALPMLPTLFRVFRGELLDVMSGDFVEAMRARGLSERIIVYRHALRNMLGPSATFVALLLGTLIGGSIIVETIFSWPGIGNLTISSVSARDFAVVQSIIIVVAAFYVLLNLAADILVLVIDPRVRVGAAR